MSHKTGKSFKTYIPKIIKSLNNNSGTTHQSLDVMDDTFRYLLKHLVSVANRLSIEDEKKTITLTEAKSACELLFNIEMVKLMNKEGDLAISRYEKYVSKKEEEKNSTTTDSKALEKNTKVMKQEKAGLILSVSLIESYLRDFSNLKISVPTMLFLTSSMEVFIREFLNSSSQEAKNHKRVRISVRDIFIAVESNPLLKQVTDKLNILYIGVGVVPGIDKRIIESYDQKTKRKRKGLTQTETVTTETVKTEENNDTTKKQKWRPGTVAIRDIKHLQKETDNQLCKSHIKSQCAKIFKMLNNDCMITEHSRSILHNLIERDIVTLFHESNKWCLHAKKTTLTRGDVQEASRVLNMSVKNLLDIDCFDVFSDPAIARLAKRAGVYRMGKEVCSLVRGIICNQLYKYISSCVILKDRMEKKIINPYILKTSLSVYHNINIACPNLSSKKTKKNTDLSSQTNNEDIVTDTTTV